MTPCDATDEAISNMRSDWSSGSASLEVVTTHKLSDWLPYSWKTSLDGYKWDIYNSPSALH